MSSATAPRDWDASTYDRVSEPQVRWGLVVLDRMALEGGETVLDAGCGSGRVTRHLLERLPRGRVIAVDAAPSMVELARKALGDRADVLQADLATLSLEWPVDAVFSSAVFHWVPDHDALFGVLHRALRPGGRLIAQCGGKGNVEAFHERVRAVAESEPFAAHLAGWAGPWNFAGAEETDARLRRAGFVEVECGLEPTPIRPDYTQDYLRVVCLGHHLERLPEDLRASFVERVHAALPEPVELDYVRLNISARRAG